MVKQLDLLLEVVEEELEEVGDEVSLVLLFRDQVKGFVLVGLLGQDAIAEVLAMINWFEVH